MPWLWNNTLLDFLRSCTANACIFHRFLVMHSLYPEAHGAARLNIIHLNGMGPGRDCCLTASLQVTLSSATLSAIVGRQTVPNPDP